MQDESLVPGISQREEGFLNRLSRKYEGNEDAGLVRSYLIATAVILVLFSLAHWIPYWWLGLIVVEVIGLALFRQYKRFAIFKTKLLRKLWLYAKDSSSANNA